MEVSCPACAARYTADDSKLRGKTARMRCRACDTVWLVSGPSSASAASGSDDLDNTAPRAAVTRRGNERERRDLFASRPVEDGGVKETIHPPPPSSAFGGTSGVAARNENSVLFKVTDVLGPAGTARLKTPEPSSSPTSFAVSSGAPGSASVSRNGKEDSGIIDLKALSTAAPRANRAPAPMLFGASEPPPAFSRDIAASSSSYPHQPGAPVRGKAARTFGMIAGAVAVVALCGLGVAVAFGGENPPPKAAAAPAPPPPPAPPPVVTPPPAPEPAATATASASEETSSKKTTGGKKRKGGGKSNASSGVITSKSPPPPPPAKVKPADPCGCHGDFNCILACTAGKK